MGVLFSSCFKQYGSDEDNQKSENGDNISEQCVVQGNSGGQLNSQAQKTMDIEKATNQRDIANPSIKQGIQTSTAYDCGSFSSADSNTLLIPVNPIPYVDVNITIPDPVSRKPIRYYDYICEFLFDVKADFLDENRCFIVSFGENTHGKKIVSQSPIFQTYSQDQDLNTLTNSQMEDIVKDIIGSFPEAENTIQIDYVQLFLCGNMLTGNSLFKDNAIKETDVVKVIVSCL